MRGGDQQGPGKGGWGPQGALAGRETFLHFFESFHLVKPKFIGCHLKHTFSLSEQKEWRVSHRMGAMGHQNFYLGINSFFFVLLLLLKFVSWLL